MEILRERVPGILTWKGSIRKPAPYAGTVLALGVRVAIGRILPEAAGSDRALFAALGTLVLTGALATLVPARRALVIPPAEALGRGTG